MAWINNKQSHVAFDKAIYTTINKLLIKARRAIAKSVQKEYNVKLGMLTRKIQIRKAFKGMHTGYMSLKSNKLKFYAFSATKRKEGISIMIRRSTGRHLIRHAFIATMPSGHKNVFTRYKNKYMIKKPKKQQLKGWFSTSPSGMIHTVGDEAFKKVVRQETNKVFQSQLKYYLGL
jgi:hypothetical protein